MPAPETEGPLVAGDLVGAAALTPLLLLDPLDEEFLELFLGVDAFVDQERIHGVHGRFESVISGGKVQGFFKRHGSSPGEIASV